jgi:hypothetical protein
VAICLLSSYSSPVLAVDDVVDDPTFRNQNDIIYVAPEESVCTSSAGDTTSDIPITGGDNEEKAWNYLTGKGLTGEQAAGIMGNIAIESHFDPLASNAGNYLGIAQWDVAGRWAALVRWAHANGLDERKFETQLKYLWKEATTRTSGNIEGLKKYNDIPHTTWYWGRFFEVAIISGSTSETPLTNVQALSERTTAAQDIFDRYSGSTPGGDAATVGSPSSSDCSGTSGGSTSGTVGAGHGDFIDSGEVNGWSIVEANAILTDSVWGTRLRYNGWCASIVARVWQGADLGFGYAPHYAMTLWEDHRSLVHADHNAKKGAILIYTGGTEYGHVTIYLGNNRILNDGHIEDATEKGEDYLGWVDPNDLVWQSPHRLTSVDFLSPYQYP